MNSSAALLKSHSIYIAIYEVILTLACCFRFGLQEALQEESQRCTLEVSELRQNVDRLQAQVEKDAVVLQQKAQVNVHLADYKPNFVELPRSVFQGQNLIQLSRL